MENNCNKEGRNTHDCDFITIHGYEEKFAVNVNVSIYKDGGYIGKVTPFETIKIPLETDCELGFKAGIRKCSINVERGVDTHVYLSFDRFTGKLKAYTANEDNKLDIRDEKRKNASKATFYSIILILACFLFLLVKFLLFR